MNLAKLCSREHKPWLNIYANSLEADILKIQGNDIVEDIVNLKNITKDLQTLVDSGKQIKEYQNIPSRWIMHLPTTIKNEFESSLVESTGIGSKIMHPSNLTLGKMSSFKLYGNLSVASSDMTKITFLIEFTDLITDIVNTIPIVHLFEEKVSSSGFIFENIFTVISTGKTIQLNYNSKFEYKDETDTITGEMIDGILHGINPCHSQLVDMTAQWSTPNNVITSRQAHFNHNL